MNRSGFTLIEIVITVTLVGVLMMLGVVSLNSAMVSSRDDKRKTDIETIASNLENYYTSGNYYDATIGQYPSLDASNPLTDGVLTTNTDEMRLMSNIDPNTLIAPGSAADTISSIIPATNEFQAVDTVEPKPTIIQYVYQPISNEGTLCITLATQNCRKFNLYYMTEADSVIHMVTSRHQ